ncbi:MAG: leucine-rich repeat domain-containing protein [Clostridia bacterium]|nr:leucine-rich repeat domain-containing protein [Clostridia bacterium]
MPNSIIFVGESALYGCNELSYTTYNNGKYIGNDSNPYYVLVSVVNSSCTSFTAHNDTKCILQNFMGLDNLTSVSVPNGVTSVVSGIDVDVDFVNRGAGTLKNNLVYIGNSSNPYLVVIGNRYWNTTITIQSTTKVIASNALGHRGYSNTELVIPDSVQYIGDNNFSGSQYQYAKTVKIGSGVVDLDGAFVRGGSSNVVESFEVSANNKYYASKDGVLFNKDFTSLINYPASKEGTSYTVPSTCKYIYPQAFYYNKNLTSVEMPDSVISIGAEAFYFSASLTSVSLSSRITNISDYAFAQSGLASVEMPSNITCVSRYTFSNCENLTNIKLSAGATNIGKSAFSRCSNLIRLDIPEGVRNLEGIMTFYDCSKLESVTIPGSIVNIGASFEDLPALNKVYYNGTLEQWCKVKLARVSSNPMYCDAELYINGELLSGQIKLPDGLTTIEDYAFAGSNITSIEIPSSVTRIGFEAFYKCDNLTIYCEAESQPDGWDSNWNYSNRPVVWGYKK